MTSMNLVDIVTEIGKIGWGLLKGAEISQVSTYG